MHVAIATRFSANMLVVKAVLSVILVQYETQVPTGTVNMLTEHHSASLMHQDYNWNACFANFAIFKIAQQQ